MWVYIIFILIIAAAWIGPMLPEDLSAVKQRAMNIIRREWGYDYIRFILFDFWKDKIRYVLYGDDLIECAALGLKMVE